MLLGGLRYLLPVIEEAHKEGYHVITCDYLPNNIAHKFSDEFYNVSVIDKEAVLEVARKCEIDGIMSFAVDPGVVTAAYVAEKMNLPFQGSAETVAILQDKSRFRKFLYEHGFNVPHARGYDNLESALGDFEFFNWPIIVKPVDSAGSKGVSRVDSPHQLEEAVKIALKESHCGKFIIEDFIEKDGPSSDSDCFAIDGKLVFCSFSDQHFDSQASNPYTPASYTWPSNMPKWAQTELKNELQRLMTLLNIKTGIFNIETRLGKNGETYIMEVSPRGGGNRLAEMLNYATGSNLIKNAVRAAVGDRPDSLVTPEYKDYIAEIILHSDEDGLFQNIDIKCQKDIEIIETDLWVENNDIVSAFTGANNAIGTLVLRSSSKNKLEDAINNISSWCKIMVK